VLLKSLFSVAHEAAHMWNGEQFSHEVAGGGWLHEGSADAFAYRALLELGIIDRALYRERLSEAASLCAFGLGGDALKVSRPGRNDYTCGFVIAALSEAVARGRSPRGDIFSFWRAIFSGAHGGTYDDSLYLRTLESAGGEQAAATVRQLVNEPLPAAGQIVEGALRAAGARLRADEPGSSDEYRRLAVRRALAAIAESDCGPGGQLVPGNGFVQIRSRDPCRTLRPEHMIQSIARLDLAKDGPAVYDHVRDRCGNGKVVELGLRNAAQILEVPCRADLPLRPEYFVLDTWPPIDDLGSPAPVR
jgi:hypothetical protein